MNLRLKSPINVQIEVTGNCTSECQHCYNFWRDKGERTVQCMRSGSLSRESATLVMQKIGASEVFDVTITGGEPLLNPEATIICIGAAKSMGMGVGLNSNLVLLTEESARQLKTSGLNGVLTSILGPSAEVHDFVTQRPGSFDRLIRGISIAREMGINVSANMVVSKLNYNQVRATATLVKKLGIESFMATRAGCPGNCSDFSHLELSQSQLVTSLNDLCWAHDNLGLKVDTLEPVPFCALYEVANPNLFASRKCTAGITFATISYDGSVRPCPHLDMSYGNILHEDFGEIWSRMSWWSQMFQIPQECSGCPVKTTCMAGCRMAGKIHTGRIDGLDPYARIEYRNEIKRFLGLSTNKSKTLEPKLRFRTKKFRRRKEAFGGVVVARNTSVFLDFKGFSVVSQLQPETTYELSTMSIDWFGLDPNRFVYGLVRRRVVDFV